MEETLATSAPTLRGGLSPEASRLFRVYKTVLAMLYKRGYMVSTELRAITPAAFTNKFGEHPSRDSLTILVVRFPYFMVMMTNNHHLTCLFDQLLFLSLAYFLNTACTYRKKQMIQATNCLSFSRKMRKLE